jgi:hypothetical protein
MTKEKKVSLPMHEDGDVNLEEMLNDICTQIVSIYKKTMNPHLDAHSVSKPLDLLTMIESAIEHGMQEISVIEGIDQGIVRDQEKLRKGEYKKR